MKLPQLKETAFGNTLRKGSLIIGWLALVSGAIIFLALCVQFQDVMNNYESRYRSRYMYDDDRVMDEEDIKRMFRIRSGQMFDILFGMFASFCAFTLSGLLLIGIYKRKPGFMLPAIISKAVFLALFGFTAFHEAFSYRGIDRDVFQMIVYGSIAYYCFLVVYSHYRELKETARINVFSHQILSNESIMAQDTPIKSPLDNSIA